MKRMVAARLAALAALALSALAALGLVGCGAATPAEPRTDTQASDDVAEPPPVATVDAAAPTYVFVCTDGYEFVAKIGADAAWVFRPAGTVSLARQVSASGVKYGDGTVTLWTKGEEALLEEVDAIHRECRNDRRRAVWEHAKLNGVDFRAVGNEPGWVLEIVTGATIVVQTDYGAKRYVFDLPPAEENAETQTTLYRTRADGHGLSIALRAQPCRDTMSDESFETQVTVVLDGRTLQGCGRPLH